MPAGLGAIYGEGHVPHGGLAQLVLFLGVLDIGYGYRQEEIEKVHLDKSKWSEKTIVSKKAVELNNGRAAMMGILGLMTHELIDGKPYVLNGLLGIPVAFNSAVPNFMGTVFP